MTRWLWAFLALGLVWASAQAQTASSFVGTSTNPSGLPLSASGYGVEAEATIGVPSGPILNGGSAVGLSRTIDNTSSLTPQGMLTPRTLALFADVGGGLMPDWFKTAADGMDDAPSIQRAINALCGAHIGTLHFYARGYNINSTISQPCAIRWVGQGWQEPIGGEGPRVAVPGLGTWFRIGTDFIGSGLNVITLTGNANGSEFRDIGFYEVQPAPAASWSPSAYAWVILAQNINGAIFIRHVMMLAVTYGILADIVNRPDIDGLWGQAFLTLLKIQHCYDIARVTDVHSWPFWTSNANVLVYQQTNLTSLVLGRVDGIQLDRIFGLAQLAMIQSVPDVVESGQPGGVATKIQAGSITADFTKYPIWVTSGATGVTAQIGNLETQGETWNATTSLTGAVAIEIDGQAMIQIGNLQTQFTDSSVLRMDNARVGSTINIGAQSSDFRFASTTTAYLDATATTPVNTVTYATVPQATTTTGKILTYKLNSAGTISIPSVTSASP